MKRITGAGLALILGATVLPAMAVDEMRPYVTGGYSYIFEDESRASDNGQGFFLGAGKSLSEHWGLEFGAFYDQFDKLDGGAGNNWREYGGKLDGLFFYSRDRRFSPYVGLGVGGIQTDLKNGGSSSTDPFADLGVGFFKYFDIGSGDVGLRADLRYRWIDTDLAGIDDFQEPVVRIGLAAALGPKPLQATDAAADQDGDGIADASDLCPDTPRGVKVDAKGCPVDLDSDGDGVPDSKDKCPGTSKGLAVDADGCPVGKEGKGFRVIGEGSERRFEDVNFAFDRSDLNDYAQGMLDDAAKLINELGESYPTLRVKVDGHTDWIGTDGYNMGLGERRASAVKQYLMRKGVAGDRIDTTSYGESKPVAPNTTDEGRAANRRAELRTTAEQ